MVQRNTAAASAPRSQASPDALDDLAAFVKKTTIEYCAKVAEIHRNSTPNSSWSQGYNAAVADIAAKIREL